MSAPNNANVIDEEWVCIDSLSHYLRLNLGYQDIQVQRERDDPPDFWVAISGEMFAAEMTSIVSDQETKRCDRPTLAAYHALCEHLEAAILQQAKSNNCLKGRYALIIQGCPEIPRRQSKEWQKLIREATNFIAATMSVPSTDVKVINEDEYGYLALQKLSNDGESIGTAGPFIFRWEGEAETELLALIQKRIDKKRASLEKKGVPTKCPNIILLLYDAYGFCDIRDAYRVLRKSSGYEWFHSIYWAASFTDKPNDLSPDNPGRLGAFLYSKKAEWCCNME